MDAPITQFVEQISAIDLFEAQINALGVDDPQKAYLVGIAVAKLADRVKKNHTEGFRRYYDTNKELPGGFECKVSTRRTYAFEENSEWSEAKSKLDEIEAKLKNATDQKEKGNVVCDETTGEIIDPVSVKWTEVYSVTRK